MPVQGKKRKLKPQCYSGQEKIRDTERTETLGQGSFLDIGHVRPDVRRDFQAGKAGHERPHLGTVFLAKTWEQFRLDESTKTDLALFQEGIKALCRQ